MKLSVLRGGGLAGMVTRTELASDALPAEKADELHEKVLQSGVLDLPAEAPPPDRHPDELQYELTVEHEGGAHTVRLPETKLPEEVRSLIEWADSVPERKEEMGPPGRGG
jgi:hypothetical protein